MILGLLMFKPSIFILRLVFSRFLYNCNLIILVYPPFLAHTCITSDCQTTTDNILPSIQECKSLCHFPSSSPLSPFNCHNQSQQVKNDEDNLRKFSLHESVLICESELHPYIERRFPPCESPIYSTLNLDTVQLLGYRRQRV